MASTVTPINKQAVSKPGEVRVTSDKPISAYVNVMVGDKELRVTKAVITILPGDFIRLELETYVDHLDIAALERDTQIKIKQRED